MRDGRKILAARPGLVIRDPETKLSLGEIGREIKINSYWLRRIADGDVVVIKQHYDMIEPRRKKINVN